MTLSPLTRRILGLITGLALLVVYAPLALVLLNSFNTSRTFAWPPTGLHHQVVVGGVALRGRARRRSGRRSRWPSWPP